MGAISMNAELFREMMREKKTLLVDYWAPWCVHCRGISAAYDKVAEQSGDGMVVAKVNIDEEADLADQERIEAIPTLVLYRDGKAAGAMVAPASKAAIDAFIERTLNA